MAEPFGQDNENESNVVDFDDFCKNFSFSNITTCYHCNVFCGSNQPVCRTCHTVLFPSIVSRKRSLPKNDVGSERRIKKRVRFHSDRGVVGDYTSRSTEQPGCSGYQRMVKPSSSSSSRAPLMLKDLNDFFGVVGQNLNKKKKNNETRMNRVNAVGNGNAHINDLPPEILGKIFADLDEKSLIAASKVSKRWEQTVAAQQSKWKKITMKRWPLLDRKTETTNWFEMYTALRSSCCCRFCLKKIMETSDSSRTLEASFRARRDLTRGFDVNGIKMMPLNGKLAHLQATIVGPPDSPYEGGKFFLQIHLSPIYPYQRPSIKFLTKIIHPNISRHGDIGLDVLTWNYSMAQPLSALLLSIQSLLGEAYTQECMEPELGRLYDTDRRRFDALAKYWTKKYAMMDEIIFDN